MEGGENRIITKLNIDEVRIVILILKQAYIVKCITRSSEYDNISTSQLTDSDTQISQSQNRNKNENISKNYESIWKCTIREKKTKHTY